jgi:hypothetical protein
MTPTMKVYYLSRLADMAIPWLAPWHVTKLHDQTRAIVSTGPYGERYIISNLDELLIMARAVYHNVGMPFPPLRRAPFAPPDYANDPTLKLDP